MAIKHNTIFLIVGESGSGKTTICNQLEQDHGLKQVESYTTRPRRSPDEKGHIFIANKKRWEIMNPQEHIVAETNFAGHDYWATEAQIDEADLYVIDPYGVCRFKKLYSGNKQIKTVYVQVGIIERFMRMVRRGDGVFNALKRVLHDIPTFWAAKPLADCVLWNGKPIPGGMSAADKLYFYIKTTTEGR